MAGLYPVTRPSVIVNAKNVLISAFKEEKFSWRPYSYCTNISVEQGLEIGGEDRDIVVHWLLNLNTFFEFSTETLSTAVSIIDQVFHTIKAHPKYLYCIALACFHIAVKLKENEGIPTILHFLEVSGDICNTDELQRMELVILKTIRWNVRRVTTSNFAHSLHRLMMLNYPIFCNAIEINSHNFLLWLEMKLKSTLEYYKLAAFRPSLIVLSLFSIGLEIHCRAFLAFVAYIRDLFKIDRQEFLVCREELSGILQSPCKLDQVSSNNLKSPNLPVQCKIDLEEFFVCHEALSCIVQSPREPDQVSSNNLKSPDLPVQCKVNEPDLDDIYDSIKYLYIEDKLTPCSSAAQDLSLADCKLPVTAD